VELKNELLLDRQQITEAPLCGLGSRLDASLGRSNSRQPFIANHVVGRVQPSVDHLPRGYGMTLTYILQVYMTLRIDPHSTVSYDLDLHPAVSHDLDMHSTVLYDVDTQPVVCMTLTYIQQSCLALTYIQLSHLSRYHNIVSATMVHYFS